MHLLILGQTESGKTTMAKRLIRQMKKKGMRSLVLDPLADPGFNADFMTKNPAEFMRVVKQSRNCLVITDESGEAIGRYNPVMNQLATRMRHWGHTCIFLCQRAQQIAPIIRDQCGGLILFNSSYKDGVLLSNEFNEPVLAQCSALKQGEFYYKTRFNEVIKDKLF